MAVKKTGIERACEVLGGQRALARAIGRATGVTITSQAVSAWVQQGYAPTGRLSLIARLTKVSIKDLADPRIADAIQN